AGVHKFASADFPGASASQAFDIAKGTVVGYFEYSVVTPITQPTAFTFHGGQYKALSVPETVSRLGFGVNDFGKIVGNYLDLADLLHGFLDVGGTFTKIDFPGATATAATDINNSGEIVGVWDDSKSVQHGFSDSGGVFTSIDFPGAIATNAGGINSTGVIVWTWTDASNNMHGFTLNSGVYTTLEFSNWVNKTGFCIKKSGGNT